MTSATFSRISSNSAARSAPAAPPSDSPSTNWPASPASRPRRSPGSRGHSRPSYETLLRLRDALDLDVSSHSAAPGPRVTPDDGVVARGGGSPRRATHLVSGRRARSWTSRSGPPRSRGEAGPAAGAGRHDRRRGQPSRSFPIELSRGWWPGRSRSRRCPASPVPTSRSSPSSSTPLRSPAGASTRSAVSTPRRPSPSW